MSPFPLGVQLPRDLPPVDDGRNRAPAIEFNPDMLQNRLISAVTVQKDEAADAITIQLFYNFGHNTVQPVIAD